MDRLASLQHTLHSLLVESNEFFPDCSEIIQVCRVRGWKLAIMGGFLRDLDIKGPHVIPRDIDLVIEGPSTSALNELLVKLYGQVTLNSYGGFKVAGSQVSMDIWTIEQTWAFKEGYFACSLENLSKTTFLDLDSLVAIYDGNDFKCVEHGYTIARESKSMGLNFIGAPGSTYSVMKALTLAVKYDFAMKLDLLNYLQISCLRVGLRELARQATEEHERHYKPSMFDTATVGAWLRMICHAATKNCPEFILPPRKALKQVKH